MDKKKTARPNPENNEGRKLIRLLVKLGNQRNTIMYVLSAEVGDANDEPNDLHGNEVIPHSLKTVHLSWSNGGLLHVPSSAILILGNN